MASIALAGAVFYFFAIVAQAPDRHESDFYSFWAGARLVGPGAGPGLYEASQAEAIQHAVSPLVNNKRFIRPPFFAVALWPLGRLPFGIAYNIWQAANISAILLSIALWRFRASSYLACAFFAPLWSCLRLGQDAPLLLLVMVAAVRFLKGNRDLLAGALLALFTAKPNLAPLIPFLLLIQKRIRALNGFLAGGVALYLISAIVMGFDWLIPYTRAVLANEGTIWPRVPGLASLFTLADAPRWTLALPPLIGAALVYRFGRHAEWRYAAAFTLAVAVVFAPRSMVYDLVLLLPLLLLRFPPWMVVILGGVLITIVSSWAPLGAVAAIVIVCWCAWRPPNPAPQPLIP